MSYDMELRDGTLRYQIRCDECDNRFADPIDGEHCVVDVERAETQAKRTGWRIRHDLSTGVRRHQCNRHKTLARMGQAMRISQEARNKR